LTWPIDIESRRRTSCNTVCPSSRNGVEPNREKAGGILASTHARLSSYERIGRIELSEPPKTLSDKVRRVELHASEAVRGERGQNGAVEFREEEFGIRGGPEACLELTDGLDKENKHADRIEDYAVPVVPRTRRGSGQLLRRRFSQLAH
jgi:hypothetical protein